MFSNITIRYKMLIAVAIPCVGLLIVSLLSWQANRQLADNASILYNNTAKPMRAMAEVASRIPRTRVGFDMMLLQETALRDERGILTRVQETRSEDIPAMREAIELAVAVQVDPENQRRAQDLLNEFERMVREEITPMLAALERGDIATAQTVYRDQYAKTYGVMRVATNEILDALEENAGFYYEQSKATASSSLAQQFSGFIFILLLSIGISWFIVSALRRRVKLVNAVMGKAASQMTLNNKIELNGSDELAQIGESFNFFIDKVRALVSETASDAGKLTERSDVLAGKASKSRQLSQEQSDQLNQVTVSMHELGGSVNEISNSANATADSVIEVQSVTSQGQKLVNDTQAQIGDLALNLNGAKDAVESLAEQVEAISGTLSTIRGVSEQTNLLALNAAIEAARAGEQGRGFAVVADEVRALASRSAASTEEIQTIIDQLKSKSGAVVNQIQAGYEQSTTVVEYSKDASTALDEISSKVSSISDAIVQVAAGTDEQKKVMEQSNYALELINVKTSETAEIANELDHDSEDLKAIAGSMSQSINRFEYS